MSPRRKVKRGRHPNQESKGPQRREVAFERAEELAEPNKTLMLASLNGLDDSFWTMKRNEQVVAFTERLSETSITQEEIDDCRRGLLSSMDALSDSLAALEGWYYGQITRGEPLYPPEYGKVLTSAVSLDEVRQTLQSYSYSVCYAVTAEPGTQGKGGSEDVE